MMKQEDTKQRILDKALELFSARGYDSVSVGEIAEAVGIKAPSLYNHFPGKQAIFDAIVESTAAQYEADTGRLDIHDGSFVAVIGRSLYFVKNQEVNQKTRLVKRRNSASSRGFLCT